jgi:threonylcarbamoyladenosine tRNA methylthiotransferase CDKAL1
MPGVMKAYVEAYGCTLNFGESREIEDFLSSKGWDLVSEPDDSDLVILATCVVIETTERAMLKRVKALSGSRRLIITGCMATACREKAEQLAPHALFFAPGDIESLSRMIDGTTMLQPTRERERESYGIVPIATGCRGTCSYCITRLARGELRSRLPARILDAVRKEASRGSKEIQLTAQDTAAYGCDIGTDLPALVDEICRVPLDFRLRIGMMNPKSALQAKERIAEMYLQKKVFKFLHLPVQSASDRLLEHMERGYNVDDFRSIVERVRGRVPRLTLSTDLIVGYPGETDSDHRRNLSFVSELRPDIVNVTRFSARPGTKAASSGGRVVGWRAKDRSREITDLRFKVAEDRNRIWVGEVVTALSTEKGKGKSTILRNDEYKQIVVPEMLPLGRYFEVTIKDATPTYLVGERIGL